MSLSTLMAYETSTSMLSMKKTFWLSMPKFSPQNGTVSESEAHSYAVIRDCVHKAFSLTRAQNIVTIDTKNETLMSLGLVVRFSPTSDYASVQQGGPPIRCGPLIPHVIGSEPTVTHHQTARPSRLLRRTPTHITSSRASRESVPYRG